jgi:putative SOS response-associated peptidase YedK
MCNKYRSKVSLRAVAEAARRQLQLDLLLSPEAEAWLIPEVVYPRREGLFLRAADGGLEPALGHWNLTPFFHRGPFKDWKASTNNCRSETMATSPSFREAFKSRRAIVPATSYVEWTGPKGSKTEHDLSGPGGMLFMAGLWDRCQAGDSYTLVMMDARGEAARFHNRMPVILDAETARLWLDVARDPGPALKAPEMLTANPPEPAPG